MNETQNINELARVQADRTKFKAICHEIGYNNAVGEQNHLNSVSSDYKKIEFCKALIKQGQKREHSQTNKNIELLKAGHKIRLGGVY